MNDYTQLMDELKNTSIRLDKDNYQKAHNNIINFFLDFRYSTKYYSILQVERTFDFPEGRTRELSLERITEPKPNSPNIKLMYVHFYESPLDDPCMQDIQVDTYPKSQNSHKYAFFQKDGFSGLYLINDFLPENLKVPEERLFTFNK